MRCNLCVVFTAALFTIFLPMLAGADPLPGRDVTKFIQWPMIITTVHGPNGPEIFHGHDELSTAWGVPNDLGNVDRYQGTFMADDFADHFDSPVVHVKWWGSYMNRPTNLPPAEQQVGQFLISFENDVPAPAAGGFSHPGEEKFNQIVKLDGDGVLTKGEGTFTERLLPETANFPEPIYEYNAELHFDKPFRQKAETVYWLKIVALDEIPSLTIPLDQRLQWGWHNRDYTVPNAFASRPPLLIGPGLGEHIDGSLPIPDGEIPIWHFQDDAVSGAVAIDIVPTMPIMPIVVQTGFEPQNYKAPEDGPSLIATHSKDLAFALYTIPEPATIALALVALVAGGFVRRGRRT